MAAALLIALGSGEALTLALGGADPGFGLAGVAGYLLLSGWLVASGIGRLLGR